MQSFKKLITLTLVALLGATMGVGSTFGWWQDVEEKSTVEAPKSKTETTFQGNLPASKPDELKPSNSKPVIVEVEEVQDVPVVYDGKFTLIQEPGQFKQKVGAGLNVVIGKERDVPKKKTTPESENSKGKDDVQGELSIITSSKQPHVFDMKVLPNQNRESIERLIRELKIELKQSEAKGKKETAETQRRVIDRLTDVLNSQPDQRVVSVVQPKATVLLTHKLAQSADATRKLDAAKKKIHQQIEELQQDLAKADDESQRQKLHARMNQLKEELEQAHRNDMARLDPPAHIKMHSKPSHAEGIQFHIPVQSSPGSISIGAQLRMTAEQLEKNGHKEAAQVIRQGAERIERDLRDKDRISDHHKVEGRPQITTVYVESDAKTDGRTETVPGRQVLRVFQKGAVQGDQEVYFKDAPKLERRIVEQHVVTSGKLHVPNGHEHPPVIVHQELRDLLGDLRREISQLKDEVRGLRHELKHDGKRAVERDDDGDDDARDNDGRAKVKSDDLKPGKTPKRKAADSDDEAASVKKSKTNRPGKYAASEDSRKEETRREAASDDAVKSKRDEDRQEKDEEDPRGDDNEEETDPDEGPADSEQDDEKQTSSSDPTFSFFVGLRR